jgi:hypothetical protein
MAAVGISAREEVKHRKQNRWDGRC